MRIEIPNAQVTISEEMLRDLAAQEGLVSAPKASDTEFVAWVGEQLDEESIDRIEFVQNFTHSMPIRDRMEAVDLNRDGVADLLYSIDCELSEIVEYVMSQINLRDLLEYADAKSDDIADVLEEDLDMQVLRRCTTVDDQLAALTLTPADLVEWLSVTHPNALPKQDKLDDVPTLALIKELMNRAAKES